MEIALLSKIKGRAIRRVLVLLSFTLDTPGPACRKLGDAAAELSGDSRERSTDAGGQSPHACRYA
jgi:hypothetical protein